MEVKCIKATKRLDEGGKHDHKQMVNVAAYCRVSTDEAEQIKSFESQKKYYRQKIQERDGWKLVDIYADMAMSGTKSENRPDLQRMLNDCRAGDIDLVITKSISRFARNTYETLKYVRELQKLNVGIMFEEECINTLSMDGELILSVLSAAYQQEIENISSHVKKGLMMKMQRGELVGYSACLGYDYDKVNKKLIINEEEAETVRYIFRRYLDGIGAAKIAKELQAMGVRTKRGSEHWAPSTVNNIIKNEKYVGDLLQGKTYTADAISKKRRINKGEFDKYQKRDTHNAIISREDFALAQEIRTGRSAMQNSGEVGVVTRFGRQYTFSHMMECGFCGAKYVRRIWHGKTNYEKIVWQCSGATRDGRKNCPYSKTVSEPELERAFVESFNRVISMEEDGERKTFEELLQEIIKKHECEDTADKIDKKIVALQMKVDKLVEMKVNGEIVEEDFSKLYNRLRLELDDLKNKKKSIEKVNRVKLTYMQRLKAMNDFLDNESKLIEFNKYVFEALISKMTIGVTSSKGERNPNVVRFYYVHDHIDDVVFKDTSRTGRCLAAKVTDIENKFENPKEQGITSVQRKSLDAMLNNGTIDKKVYKRTVNRLKKINDIKTGFAGG